MQLLFGAGGDEVCGLDFVLDRLIAEQARDHLRVPLVGEDPEQRLTDVVRVVVQQEVEIFRVVDRAIGNRDRRDPSQGLHRVGLSRRLAGRRLLAEQRAREGLARDACRGIASRALDQVVVPLERGQRAYDIECNVRIAYAVLECRPLPDSVGGEQLGDAVTFVHRHERDHGLPAEQLLVRDVVLVDLVALVQVVVLARRELQPGGAEAEARRQQTADEQHRQPVLAEVESEPAPELVHGPECTSTVMARA